MSGNPLLDAVAKAPAPVRPSPKPAKNGNPLATAMKTAGRVRVRASAVKATKPAQSNNPLLQWANENMLGQAPVGPPRPPTGLIPGLSAFDPKNLRRADTLRTVAMRKAMGVPLVEPGEWDPSQTVTAKARANPSHSFHAMDLIRKRMPEADWHRSKEDVRRFVVAEMGGAALGGTKNPLTGRPDNASGTEYGSAEEVADAFFRYAPKERKELVDRYIAEVRPRARRRETGAEILAHEAARGRVGGNMWAQLFMDDKGREQLAATNPNTAGVTMAAFDSAGESFGGGLKRIIGAQAAQEWARKNPQGAAAPLALAYGWLGDQAAALANTPLDLGVNVGQFSPDATGEQRADMAIRGGTALLNAAAGAGAVAKGLSVARAVGGVRGVARGAVSTAGELLSPVPLGHAPTAVDPPAIPVKGQASATSVYPAFARGRDQAKYSMRWELRELEDVVASHDHESFAPNPKYRDMGVQPRDRSRAEDQLQVRQLAKNLDPEQYLEPSSYVERGAPIIDTTGQVEHGNGRVMGLKLAKRINPKAFDEYQNQIRARFPEASGFKEPVLVRVRAQDIPSKQEFEQYLRIGSTPTGKGLSVVEQARADAAALRETFWDNFEEVGDSMEDALRSPKNAGRVAEFLRSIPQGEHAGFLDATGLLSEPGAARIKRASLFSLLGEEGMKTAERVLETGDLSRRIGSGLFRAMPQLLKAKTPELTDALNWALKEWGRFTDSSFKTPEAWLAQARMDGVDGPGVTVFKMIAEGASGAHGSIKQVAEALREIADDASKLKIGKTQASMFDTGEVGKATAIFSKRGKVGGALDAARQIAPKPLGQATLAKWVEYARGWQEKGADVLTGLRQNQLTEDEIKYVAAKVGEPYRPPEGAVQGGLFGDAATGQGSLDLAKAPAPQTAKAAGAKLKLPTDEFQRRYDELTRIAKGMGTGIYDAGKPNAPKGTLGAFYNKKMTKFHPEGEIRMRWGEPVQDAAETLAHEVAHSIDAQMNGGKTSSDMAMLKKTFAVEDDFDFGQIERELAELTRQIEGDIAVNSDPAYFGKPTELFARFMQAAMFMPDLAENVAPTAMAQIRKLAMEHEQLGQMLEVAQGKVLGFDQQAFIRDKRQTYHKMLGRFLGERFYWNEKQYQIEKSKIAHDVRKLMKDKFDGVKDDPQALFQAAEAIRYSEGEQVFFGTWDRAEPASVKEFDARMKEGWRWFGEYQQRDPELPVLYRQRYDYDQGKKLYDSLSSQGQALIREYTQSGGRDEFNRNFLKAKHSVKGDIEGYVHHLMEDRGPVRTWFRNFLKERRAGARRQRTGSEGFTEDLKAATEKVITDLEIEAAWNKFVNRQITLAAKSFNPAVEDIPEGFIHVIGSPKAGYARPGTNLLLIDGKALQPGRHYLMPAKLWESVENANRVVAEASSAAKLIRSALHIWQGSKLAHPGSWITNFVSGHMQLAPKIIEDMLYDLMGYQGDRSRTLDNAVGYAKMYSRKGRAEAPEWVFGGDATNFAGRMAQEEGRFMAAVTHPMSAIETFMKQAIVSMEKQKVPGVKLDDPKFLKHVNDIIDTFAFDYSNVPMALDKARATGYLGAITPFPTYRYKYAKLLTKQLGAIFDKNLPVPERVAKFMSALTVLSAAAYGIDRARSTVASNFTGQRDRGRTPEAAEKLAKKGQLGRGIPISSSEGEDIYLDTKKYPFLNTAEMVQAYLRGDTDLGRQLASDHLLGLGPGADSVLTLLGFTNEFNRYEPREARLGKIAGSFVPLDRAIRDTKMVLDIDESGRVIQRSSKSFLQGLGETLPLPEGTPGLSREQRKKNGRKVSKERLDVALRFAGVSLNRAKRRG